jgi:hypothetical protein
VTGFVEMRDAAAVLAEKASLQRAQAQQQTLRAKLRPERPDELTLAHEDTAHLSSGPRKRRWKELNRFDAEHDQLQARHREAIERLREAEARLARAPQDDARALASWIAGGERGERPAPSLYERTTVRDAARMLADGIEVEIGRLLRRRVDHVERHRAKMAADAARDVKALEARWLGAVRSLPGIREELLAARATEIWARCFPDPSSTSQPGFSPMLALGLRAPVEKAFGLKTQVDFAAVVAALEADARTIVSLLTAEQAEAAGVVNENATPESEALWMGDPRTGDRGDPRAQEWAKRKLEELRELGRWNPDHEGLQTERPDL